MTEYSNSSHKSLETLLPSANFKSLNISDATAGNNDWPIDLFSQLGDEYGIFNRRFCVEDWNYLNRDGRADGSGRIYYSIFSLVVQYIVPFISISFLYIGVHLKLKRQGNRRNQFIIQLKSRETKTHNAETARLKRNTTMLATMSIVFCFCWLPQNLIFALLDVYHDFFGGNAETVAKISVICHLIGMSSACMNPLIYGFWNNTIRKGLAI